MTDNIRMISLPECRGDVSLTVEDCLRVRLDLNLAETMADTDVLKVYASSPRLPDIYLGIAETTGKRCRFEGKYDTKDACHYDTVTVVKKNAFTDSSVPFVKVCFTEDKRVEEKLRYLQSHSAYRDYLSVAPTLKSPTERGAEALDVFRTAHKINNGERKKCLERLLTALSLAHRAEFSLADGFEWYMSDNLELSEISTATEHILSHPGVLSALSRYRHLAAGFNQRDNTLCIAIPIDNPSVNPIPHLSDCTVFVKSPITDITYCTVCVIFASDGQYFARLDEGF